MYICIYVYTVDWCPTMVGICNHQKDLNGHTDEPG